MKEPVFLAVGLSIALAACRSDAPMGLHPGGTDADVDAGVPATIDGGGNDGAPDGDAALGGFVIDLVGPVVENGVQKTPAFTGVIGKIYDGATPEAVIWKIGAEAGGCRFLTPMVPFCSAGCGGNAACTEGGKCHEYPRPLSLGRVHVKGLTIGEFDMNEVAGNYQPPVPIPYPPLPEGAKVEITAPGGALGPLRLESVGIVPLELTSTVVQLVSGQPLALTWRPPTRPNISRIALHLDLSHHGGTRGKIECDVADTGSLTIPAEQITALFNVGVSGFPSIVVTRVASGEATTTVGRVTLRVVASVERAVEIEGLHSCTANQDCPVGMTCQVDLKCK